MQASPAPKRQRTLGQYFETVAAVTAAVDGVAVAAPATGPQAALPIGTEGAVAAALQAGATRVTVRTHGTDVELVAERRSRSPSPSTDARRAPLARPTWAEEEVVIPPPPTADKERSVPAAITFGAPRACVHGNGGCGSACAGEDEGEDGEAAAAAEEPGVVEGYDSGQAQSLPLPAHLPTLPKKVKGRAVGKYVSKGGPRNGHKPNVVYWNGKYTTPACWKGVCTHQPSFGCKGDAWPTRCGNCRTPTMVDLKHTLCPCGTRMTFGEVDDERPSACKWCRMPTMVDIMNKLCPCGTRMTFGEVDDERPSACKRCRMPTMVDLKSKLCPCGTRMTFGEVDDEQPSACKDCKTPTMVDIKNRMCKCGAHQPSFGFKDDARPSVCKGCRTSTMIDMHHKLCTCGKNMTFGEPGDERPSACEDCRSDSMVNLAAKVCSCGEGRAYYEDIDGNKAVLCYSCAIAEGTHPERVAGASYEACRFFCLLSRMTHKREDVPHVHWDRASGEWNGYGEVEGLVPGRKIRPDGFLPDASGATKDTAYLYHGNRWHGYPEGHPNHKGEQLFRSARTGAERCVKNADLYAKTEADTQAYPAGYTVWSKCGGMTSRRWNGATGCSRASSSGARRECGCVVCGTVYDALEQLAVF